MEKPSADSPQVMWSPTRRDNTKLDDFRESVNTKYNLKLGEKSCTVY